MRIILRHPPFFHEYLYIHQAFSLDPETRQAKAAFATCFSLPSAFRFLSVAPAVNLLPDHAMTKVEYKDTEIAAKKKLGQNFLTDRNICRKIVHASGLQENDRVLEVGPGFGALTGAILEKTSQLAVVEKDRALCSFLRKEFPSVSVIEGDFLRVDIARLASEGALTVIGNIPYAITTPILFKLLDNRQHIAKATLMMQLEVAERLVALPDTKEYGILAVQLQTFCNVDFLFKVGRKVFRPKPEVKSAVVSLTPKTTAFEADEAGFRNFVRTAFRHRRKTLRNNLKNSYDLSLVGSTNLEARAESLSIEEFLLLYKELRPFGS